MVGESLSARGRAAFRICCALTLILGTLDFLTTYLCLSRFPSQTYEANPIMRWQIEMTCLPGACLVGLALLFFTFPKFHSYMLEGQKSRIFLAFLYLFLIPTKTYAVTNNYNVFVTLQQEIYEYHGSESN
jgi:hypothetical protein